MTDALRIAATSLSLDLQRLSTISSNLANATTPGYRRELAVQRSGVAEGASFAQRIDALLPTLHTQRDLRAGTVQATGNPLDLAIDGDGWFEVLSADGTAYTRAGAFSRSADGRLVTPAGQALMGQAGVLQVGDGLVRVDSAGRVLEDGKPTGQIRLVRWPAGVVLDAVGDGLYRPRADANGTASAAAEPIAEPRLRSGQLENANLLPLAEMMRLIDTMRHAEANQKVIQQTDDMLGRALRTLGDG